MAPFILFIVAFVLETVGVLANIPVSLTSTAPAVRGSNVTFTATILSGYKGDQLKFIFSDDASPQHYTEILSTERSVNYTVEYSRDKYEAGQFTANLEVKENILLDLWWYIGGNKTVFSLTDSLHGSLLLSQNKVERPNSFVAVNKPVHHFVKIPDSEMEFLKKNSSSIYTYWYIDCVYINIATDYSLNYTYPDVMSTHNVEAIVVANNEPTTTSTTTTTTTSTTTTTTPKPPPPPPPPPVNTTTEAPTTTPKPTTTPEPTTLAPTTSSTKPTSPTLSSTTSTIPPTTTVKNATGDEDTKHKVSKRAISNRTMKKQLKDVDNWSCNNMVPISKGYTIGRYQQTIKVREPIYSINISSSSWLHQGDLLNLDVQYAGSPPFDYCVQYMVGVYNITGNETCAVKTRTVSNHFPLVHYFSDSEQHTVVVVIENEIGKQVSKSTINIYKVPVHPQLSVIVVPVFFCLVAVILVVFGIAYYQHRTRHTIEVADFDFGQANLDHKTFTERLRDSFSNAFNFRQRDDTESLTTNTRYDSMT